MIPKDTEYLKCIHCGAALNLNSFKNKNGECFEGKLSCIKCKKEWPVINFIPRILPDELLQELVVKEYPDFFSKYKFKYSEKHDKTSSLKHKTAKSFSYEWLKYPKILDQFEKDWERYFHPFIKRKDINGKVVVDYGCGMAKHGYFTAKYGAKKYIGLDLSLATEAAYANTKKFKPLIVQADIYHTPLKGELIDISYSIGVLHHLPEPEKGFLAITSLMKKNAKIFIWVYGRRKNKRAIYLYNPIRAVTTRMPKALLYPLCHGPAAAVHGFNLLYKGLSKAGMKGIAKHVPFNYYADFPYRFKVSDTYDTLGTPKQIYYRKEEIDKWFKHAKLKKYELQYDIVQGIKGYGVK